MFFKSSPQKKPSDMTEDELKQGIQRCEDTLARQPNFMTGATMTLVLGFGAGLLGSAIFLTGIGGGAMLGIAAAVGLTGCCAVGFTSKYIMTQALRTRNVLEESLPARVQARQEAEAEQSRLRQLAAQEKFNAAVDAGMPLESAIRVKRTLRLKTPPPPETPHGFSRVLSKVFAPVP